MMRKLIVLILIFVTFAGWFSPAYADSFGRPDGADQAAVASTAAPAILMPKPVRLFFSDILAAQRRLNTALRRDLSDVKSGGSWRAEAAIILISFAYGVLHAIGPGHGKFVVSAYILSRRARIVQGLAMSATAACVQALSAIGLVGSLVVVLHIGARQVLNHADLLELVSYASITIVGLSMIWGVATHRTCCATAAPLDHDHHDHHNHDHGNDDGYGAHHADREDASSRRGWLALLATGAAVGVRPCAGAILVLLFTLANAIFPLGIVATLAMGLGVAITVSAVSLMTVGLRHAVADRAALLDARARSGDAGDGVWRGDPDHHLRAHPGCMFVVRCASAVARVNQ
jgi:nickel/cobalt transporter (NicO) family protein